MKRTGRLYLIRSKSDQTQPFGIIFAKTVKDLFWLVDEYVDPYLCQYAGLGTGFGLFWEDASALFPDWDNPTPGDPPTLTDSACGQLAGFADMTWRDFTPEDGA